MTDRMGTTDLIVPRIGLGTAALGNFQQAISDADAVAVVDRAQALGVRYLDTAPLYGHGLAESRVGQAVAKVARDELIISTKVGRLLAPNPDFDGGRDLANGFDVPDDHVRMFDPSLSGVRRSLEASLERMGLDRVDVLYLHDPDVYDLERGLAEGLPALATLRDEGLVREIGIGVNDADVAARAVREGDLDLVMIAGRYTLLEQAALAQLFPACEERGVRVVDAAVFNSGLLATSTPSSDATYNYGAVPDDVLQRAQTLAATCAEFGVELPAAALQFPLRNPLVATVVVGTSRPDAVRQNVGHMSATIPDELWTAFEERGLIPADGED